MHNPRQDFDTNRTIETEKEDSRKIENLIILDYLTANLNSPQHGFGITMAIARHVLRYKTTDLRGFLAEEMSPEEVVAAARAMNRVHAAHGVPAATADAIESVRAGVAARTNEARAREGRAPLTEEEISAIEISTVDLSRMPLILRGGKVLGLKILMHAVDADVDMRSTILLPEEVDNPLTEEQLDKAQADLTALEQMLADETTHNRLTMLFDDLYDSTFIDSDGKLMLRIIRLAIKNAKSSETFQLDKTIVDALDRVPDEPRTVMQGILDSQIGKDLSESYEFSSELYDAMLDHIVKKLHSRYISTLENTTDESVRETIRWCLDTLPRIKPAVEEVS